MAQAAAPARAGSAGGYARHRPEQTLLYRIVAQHYPAFVELLAGQGRPLPDYVREEFEAYLKCGRLEHVFLRVRCESCHAEHLVAFSCKWRGFCPSCGARRMAESAALLVDEVFPEQPVRQWVLSAPYPLRFLFASRPDIMGAVLRIVYRVSKVGGFSVHAGVAARADERNKLERLRRYISRPALSQARLSLTAGDLVRYQLKTPYSDGTTHVLFELLDFIARLAALVPKPRVNLTRYHGVFAPNSAHRAQVTNAGRGRDARRPKDTTPATPTERPVAMSWAQRLKRVFGIDIEACSACGGAMRIIACIEDPVVIEKILAHLDAKAAARTMDRRATVNLLVEGQPRRAAQIFTASPGNGRPRHAQQPSGTKWQGVCPAHNSTHRS